LFVDADAEWDADDNECREQKVAEGVVIVLQVFLFLSAEVLLESHKNKIY